MSNLDFKNIQRLMIIAWKWRHPKNRPEHRLKEEDDYDFYGVEGLPTAGILRLDPCRPDDNDIYQGRGTSTELDYSITQINTLVQQLSPDCEVQIYLHASHGYSSEHVNNIDRKHTVNIFQHEDSSLYISPKAHLGLLFEYGQWGKTRHKGEIVSALTNNGQVDPKHFNFVWNELNSRLRRKVYEVIQSSVNTIMPIIGAADPTVVDHYGDQLRALDDKIEDLIKTKLHDGIQTIQDKYSDLTNALTHFQQNKVDRQAFRTVRDELYKTLNDLPGNRTYA